MKKLVWIVVGVFLVSTATRFVVREKNERALKNYQTQFTPLEDQGTFVESLPREFAPDKRYEQIVLVLHGYQQSPKEFEELYPALEKAEIPYYAPQIIGHGLEDMHLMEAVNDKDWQRQVITTYDMLSQLAKKIIVVGFSNGGSLACNLAQHRQVDHLVLIAPAITIVAKAKMIDRFYRMPILGKYLHYTVPIISYEVGLGTGWNKIDVQYQDNRLMMDFLYNYYAMNGFGVLHDTANHVDTTQMKARHIDLLLMAKDEMVNSPEVRKRILTIDPDIQVKEFDSKHKWANSAVSRDIVKYVMECIQGNK